MFIALGEYAPDILLLRSRPVTVAVGEESEGQLAYRGAVALAERLGKNPVTFPGGHGGVDSHPEAFARRLDGVFDTHQDTTSA